MVSVYTDHMYSVDIRRIAFRRLQLGWSLRRVARHLDIGATTVHRWRTQGTWTQIHRRGSRSIPLRDTHNCIRTILDDRPFLTLTQIRDALDGARNGESRISISTVRRYVQNIGYSRKRLSTKPLGIPSPERVQQFSTDYATLIAPETTVVSVDECHFSERVAPLYGYSAPGQRCVLRRWTSSWRSHSLILSICSDGRVHADVMRGSVNKVRFATYVAALPLQAGCVLLMDNCSIHHRQEDALSTKEFTPLYLPPYSPQFQPVELAFSKIKQLFRQLWPWAQGVESCILECVAQVTSSDVLGWFRQCDRIRCTVV
jgi:transposase